jgi:hypothetical protein
MDFVHCEYGVGGFPCAYSSWWNTGGGVEVLANFTHGDDFTFDEASDIYIARVAVDLISEAMSAGKVVPLDYEKAACGGEYGGEVWENGVWSEDVVCHDSTN